jgi:hypothetical protein
MCRYIIHPLLRGFSHRQFDTLKPRQTLISSIAAEGYIWTSKKKKYFTILQFVAVKI